MFPNVRLLIAAMLASVLVLICGFGVFAAFRVSHEPIAHLPVAVAPLQLVAENRAASSTVLVAREALDQHSQFDIPVVAPEETTPPAGAPEQHSPAELVAESEQTAAPQPVVAMDVEPSAAPEPEKEAGAMTAPAEQPRTPSDPASDLAALLRSSDRSADIAADPASAPSPLRLVAPAADASTAAGDAAANAAAADETAPGPETEPAAIANLAVEATPDDAVERTEGDTPVEPPLPRARPNVSNANHVGDTHPARAANERRRSVAAYRARRARVVVARSVRAVRFTTPYYAQAQYAQSIDQSYGYGQSNFQGAQEQIVVRQVVRLRPARLAARKPNAAIGGPFVSAPSP
jgi:hypothetical protein